MKLLTIDSREVTGRPGVLLDSGEILDLATAPSTLSESQWIPHSVVSVMAAGRDGIERVARLVNAAGQSDTSHLREVGALLPYRGTALLAPVRRPGLVLLVDRDGAGLIKSPNAAVGNGALVRRPSAEIDTLVGSPMLALVIGRPLFSASRAESAEAIAGYTLLMDLSCTRPDGSDAAAWRRYVDGKQFPGACPIGPVIVTDDELEEPGRLPASVRINDVEVGAGPLWPDGHDPAGRLATLSRRHAFRPGDLIAWTPSPDCAGDGRTLHPGDRFSVACPDLPELEVTIE